MLIGISGSILWRPGKRVPAVTPMRASRRIPEPHSFWMRVRLPEENNDGVDGGGLRLGATRVAPAGVGPPDTDLLYSSCLASLIE
jgi:hypothetical protein